MVSDHGKKNFENASGSDGLPRVRRSASGRIPQWAIDEAFGNQPDPQPWRAAPAPARGRSLPRVRRHPWRWRSRWATALGLALAVGLYFTPTLLGRMSWWQSLTYQSGPDFPPPGVEAAPAPLGTPPSVAGSAAYVLRESPDPEQRLVAYDPCRPVHFVIRPELAPPGSEHLILDAVAAVSEATGLQFINDGTTSEPPATDRAAYQPDRYGKRWAPVLIAWSSPEMSPDLAGETAGTGGSASIQIPGEPYVYVTGQILLDAPALTEVVAFPDGPALVRAIIMHELAHVVGLDHVSDPTQLMYEKNSGQLDFGTGDRAGLALLGTGKCVPGL